MLTVVGMLQDSFGWVEEVDTTTREHMPSDLWDGLALRKASTSDGQSADRGYGAHFQLGLICRLLCS
jgi:hypothetical protein